MSKVIIVFAAGGMGCLARYGLSHLLPKQETAFPWSTLAANLAACLLIALGAYLLRERLHASGILFLTAFCGGLSTFSAFSLEAIDLMNRGLLLMALFYVFTSLILCLLTVWLVSRAV